MIARLLTMLKRIKGKAGGALQRAPNTRTLPAPRTERPQKYQVAANSLRDMALVKSKLHLAQRDKCDPTGSHPLIVEFYRKLHKELEARGFSFYAHCFLRGGMRQFDLYSERRSNAKPGQSPHNYGLAVDIVHTVYHWELHDEPVMQERQWRLIGMIGKEVARKANIPIEWGGDWSFWDPAHWQLKDWRDIRDGKKVFDPNAYSQRVARQLRKYEQRVTPV